MSTAKPVAEDAEKAPRRSRYRLRRLLFYVNLIVLLLPVTGLWLLRIYENELARRTEAELLSQSAFIRGSYLIALERTAHGDPLPSEVEDRSHPPMTVFAERIAERERFEYIPPTLDLNRIEVLPRAEPPRAPETAPHPHAMRAGEEVSRVMRDAQRVTLSGMRIVDHAGRVVASSRGQFGESLAHRVEVERALKGEHVRLVRERISDLEDFSLNSLSRRSSVRLFVAIPIIQNDRVIGAVVTSRTPISLARAIYDNRWALSILVVFQLLAVVFLSFYVGRTIVRPVHELIDQAHRLERGEGRAEVLDDPVTLEVELLSEAIVEMAHALHERADYIQTFASNVSHEFKTPLTSIRGTVELLEDHLMEMEPHERERFFGIIDRDAARLERLVNRLLELARADVFEPGDQRSAPADIARTLAGQHAQDGVDVTVEVSPGAEAIEVEMAPVTLESILSNLLENARQHGGEEVSIEVRITDAQEREGVLAIEVIDDGGPISEGNRARIFKPFFTTARETGGTGMGLSVVRSLVRAHGGSIALKPGAPTTFRVVLPAASPGAQ